MSTDIMALVEDYKKSKAEFSDKAQEAMRTAFKDFFDVNPNIEMIAWTQYTPFFNDGDPCVFRVADMYFSLVGEKIDLVGYLDDSGMHSEYDDKVDEAKTFKKFVQEIGTIPDEIFLDAFGDHVRVAATRKGFDTEDYDHD